MKHLRPAFALPLVAVMLCSGTGSAQERPLPPPRLPVEAPRDTVSAGPDSARSSRYRYPSFDVPEYTITGDEARPMDLARPLTALYPGSGLLRSAGPGMRERDGGLGGRPWGGPRTDRFMGGVRIGFGSYWKPQAGLWLSPGTAPVDVLLDASYESYADHVPYAGGTRARAGLDIGFPAGAARMSVGAGMLGDGYHLYGSRRPELSRTVTRFEAHAELTSVRVGPVAFRGGMELGSLVLEDSLRTKEQQLGFTLGADWTMAGIDMAAEGELWSNAYDRQGGGLNPNLITVGISARFAIMDALDGEAGVGGGVRRGTDRGSIGWIDPVFGLFWRGIPDLTAYVRFSPSAARPSLARLVEEDPYIVTAPHVRAPHHVTDLHAGAAWRPSSDLRATAEFFLTRTVDAPVPVDPDSSGMWTPAYGGVVRSSGLQASLSAALSAQTEVGASVTVRSNRWSVTDGPVPYMPDVQLDVSASHRFEPGFRLVPSLHLEGARPVDPAGTRTLSSYLDIGLRAEYIVLPSFTIALSFENIFGTRRTFREGYPGVPFVATASASYTW